MFQSQKNITGELAITAEMSAIEDAKINPALFSVLYDKYYENVFRFVYQRLNDKETAFDATQNIFLKAMNNLSKYEYRGLPFASWLFRIATNELTNMFRLQNSQRTVNIETQKIQNIAEEFQLTAIDKFHDKIVAIIAKELNDDDLLLIEMRFFEKRSFSQIGEILCITENNAKVKTYRVIDKLKEIFKTKYK